MESSADTFSLLSELAITIAGFVGVAAAFGGRERAFKPSEGLRLRGIFVSSGTVFFGCLLWTTAFEAGIAPPTAQKLVSMAMVVCVAFMAFWLPATFRAARQPDSTSEAWVLIATVVYAAVVFCAYLVNALWLASSWPLAAAVSVQLVYSLWMFFRLLTRPN